MDFTVSTVKRLLGDGRNFGISTVLRLWKTVETWEIELNEFCIMITTQVHGAQGVECCGLNDSNPVGLCI